MAKQKRNRQDATLINITALKKQIAALKATVKQLKARA